MSLIDHDARAIVLRELGQCLERGDVSIHREHRVGHDQTPALALATAALTAHAPLEMLDVAMAVDHDLSARKATSVDDRGVVELV